MNKDIAQLREVIMKLVPLLTGRGLRVTQIGSSAYVRVNPTTRRPELVNIPNVSDNATPEFIRAIQGFIDHEVAHVLITEWDIYYRLPSGMKMSDPQARSFNNLMNIFEDTMIEKEIVKTFPGSRLNLSNVRKYFLERISKPAVDAAKDDKERFLYLIVPVARALAGHSEMQEWMDANGYWNEPGVKAFVDALPDDLKEKIAKAASTRDVFEIVEQVFPILYPPTPPQKQQSQPQDGGDESEEQDEQSGQSKDKPEKEAGEGDGDGERDHKENDEEEEQDGDPSDGKSGAEPDEDEDGDEAKGGATEEEDESQDGDDEDADGESSGDDGHDESDEEGAGAEENGEQSDQDGDDDADRSDDGDAGGEQSDDLSDEDAADEEGGNGAEVSDKSADKGEKDDAGEAGGEDETEADPEGSVGTFTDELPDFHEASESGGGIGNEMSRSMFDFEDDAFDGLDISSAMAEEISEAAERIMQAGDYVVLTRDFDQIKPLDPPEKINDRWIPDMENEVGIMAGKMQKDIERIMASQSHVIRTPGHRKGKLHGASLYRVLQNDDRVFSQKQEHKSKDTAVTLLCDNSGSMSGRKMRTAMLAAYALCSTLDRVKIANEVLGFTTGMSNMMSRAEVTRINDEYQRAMSSGINYDRVVPIVMPIYKTFDEKLSPTVKKRIAYAMNAQRGLAGNIDGESLEYAAERLIKRMEKRKVMIVLSDGQPAGGRMSGWHLRETVKRIEKAGIECIGIGIEDVSVKSYYPKNVVLRNVQELPGLIMNEIRQILAA